MSYLEELRASRNKPQVAYQEFALHTKKGKDGLFCFFEGKDNGYYIPRIKKYTDKYHPIQCGGREKVLKVQRLIAIHPEYNKYKKAFFIDRDFNPPLTNKNLQIFETPCYSIENFYVSENVFKEIRNQVGEQTGVNLDDKLPKNFISFSLHKITDNYNFDKIKQTFPKASSISKDDLTAKITEFTQCEQCKVFRGKYEMQFLILFIEKILQDSLKEKKYITRKINFAFNQKLTNEQAVDIFSNYAENPDNLAQFLDNITK